MEEKRPPSAVDAPASEPPPSRRRAGGNKRKSGSLNASNSSSTSSKRITREKASPLHHPPPHNGPLTRARQIPNNSSTASTSTVVGSASAPAAVKHAPQTQALAVAAEQLKKENEWESLEAVIEAEFKAIRSRDANAHVVPTHCGWFSWMNIHSIEKRMMPSFFDEKTENRTPDKYMKIRNWIMKKFHSNPNIQIELKDLSELDIGDLDARQEIMEFLDYWGLINFHPFPSTDSAVASTSDDGEAEKKSLLEKFYHFDSLQLCPPAIQKTSLMTPVMTSGLFPESAIAEELVKQEGPAVEMLEYHCNSCSGDCSRKRYHCQKQADFDLCTDCFNNRKFGSGMSSLDFILMEPAEAAGVSSGKWTDQETLLLLEALELYKENWNEIAEHVGTKSKAQCILHFVQMPIMDAFVDCDDDVVAGSKETADPAATNNNLSIDEDKDKKDEGKDKKDEDEDKKDEDKDKKDKDKDASEIIENDTSDSIKGHDETSQAEDVKVKDNQEETPKLPDGSDEKTSEETTKLDDIKAKLGEEVGDDCVLNALKEAFAAVGYSPEPEGPSSFAEVGNPVMALAAFLSQLVGSDVAVASAHNYIKSLSGNTPGTEIASRCCFLLEDPPDDKKETTTSERDFKREDQTDKSVQQDTAMLDDKDLENDPQKTKIAGDASEDKIHLASTDGGISEKSISSKGQEMINHDCELDNGNDPSISMAPKDQAQGTLHNIGGSTSKAEEVQKETSKEEPCHPIEEQKEGSVSDSHPSEKNGLQQSIKSNLPVELPKPVETPKYDEMASDSMPSDKSKPQKQSSTNAVSESQKTTDSAMDVDVVSNSLPSKIDSQPPISSQDNGTQKDVDMVSPSQPIRSNLGAENGASAGEVEDHARNGKEVKNDGTKTKQDSSVEKLKRAAVSTLAAAAVKAKLLANQEEDQIRQLTSLLIEKQLYKLEAKLAFFNDMENVVMRVKELLERSRHKLYHERALIIASRLGVPGGSRGIPPSIVDKAMNYTNSLPRPQITMNPQGPLISRPVSTTGTTLPNPLMSATAAGSSVRPSSQENLSSVGTK
ncbi:SWI/SNF complex subunit SWI3D [Trifolium pratense]|uniref:SWI/SNF complex subunit SWI3D n=1 Tax=Trifolium pratense TaxID=57577 RepID=UPI001E6904F3|nr:SWI/SNF complex subunit SWI3D [Trifolium pratense]XP_045819699.1 SWI/SNF complex subunit SWI3D [Trifolium pratense]XP_045819700.1 SWI/SNF complex subunit SWI3D [Trifolium pratense]XP_045819701.1 SWI/SNF complex subunit SWI3D [Trifolium pratense]